MRIAVLEDSRLKAALYISKTGGLPSREWLAAQLEAEDAPSSVALLAGRPAKPAADRGPIRSEEHTSELQSLMRISYAVFCLKKKKKHKKSHLNKTYHLYHRSVTKSNNHNKYTT